jgi:hypothetical protein
MHGSNFGFVCADLYPFQFMPMAKTGNVCRRSGEMDA